ncbi:MAG: hypothetical protein WC162_08930 [Sphaerochaetaceae bacterium]
MKKEILHLEKVSILHYLDEVDFYVKEGEIVGLIPLNNLGIEHFIGVIRDGLPIHYGFVTYDGKRVNDYLMSKPKKNNVLLITKKTTLIDSLTVYENLFVIRKGFSKYIINKKILINQTNVLLKSIGLNIKPETKVNDLNYFQQTALELIKAKIEYAKLVILNCIPSFLSNDEILLLNSLIKRMSKSGMSFIYICNHHQEAFLVCERCYLMKEGRMVKDLYQYEMTDEVMSNFLYLFENSIKSEERKELYKKVDNLPPSCIINKVGYNSLKDFSVKIHSNETIVLLDSDNSITDDLISLLKNEVEPKSGYIVLENFPIEKGDRRIVILDKEYPGSALFFPMSVMDNILFCTDNKLKSVWFNKKVEKAIAKNLKIELGDIVFKKDLYDLSKEDLFKILSKKLLFQKPKLVVMVQPFSSFDMYQRLKNIEYIDELKKNGTSILLLTLSLSDTLQVANRLLVVQKGTIIKEYDRSQFSALTYLHGSIPSN